MAKLDIRTYPGSDYPGRVLHGVVTPGQLDVIVREARLATYETVYASMTEPHAAGDISIDAGPAGPASRAGYGVEITVWIASDDRPRLGAQGANAPVDIEALKVYARSIVGAVEHAIPAGMVFHVWVQAGETGFCEGVGTLSAVGD